MKDLCRRLCLAALLLILLLPMPAVSARAQDCFAVETAESAMAGQEIRVAVFMEDGADLAGFRASIAYDAGKLAFQRVELAGWLPKADYYTDSSSSGVVRSVYAADLSGGKAVAGTGAVAVYLFKALPAPGKARITVTIDQAYDGAVHPVGGSFSSVHEVEISNIPPAGVRLLALEPSAGALQPPFSPECFSYELSVGSDVSTVEFQAQAAGGCTVKASRKKLSAAGKETNISITVLSADKKDKAVYQILVRRAANGPAGTASHNTGKGPHASSGIRTDGEEHSEKSGSLAPGTAVSSSQAGVQSPGGNRELFVEGNTMANYLLVGAVVLLAAALFFVGYAMLKKKKQP